MAGGNQNENVVLAVVLLWGGCLLVHHFGTCASEDRGELGQGGTDLPNFTDVAGGGKPPLASWD